jgi:hypothetical protein
MPVIRLKVSDTASYRAWKLPRRCAIAQPSKVSARLRTRLVDDPQGLTKSCPTDFKATFEERGHTQKRWSVVPEGATLLPPLSENGWAGMLAKTLNELLLDDDVMDQLIEIFFAPPIRLVRYFD